MLAGGLSMLLLSCRQKAEDHTSCSVGLGYETCRHVRDPWYMIVLEQTFSIPYFSPKTLKNIAVQFSFHVNFFPFWGKKIHKMIQKQSVNLSSYGKYLRTKAKINFLLTFSRKGTKNHFRPNSREGERENLFHKIWFDQGEFTMYVHTVHS
jgi:hypothetical protein